MTLPRTRPPATPLHNRCRGTSLIRNRPPLGLYSSICLGPYGIPRGGGGFLWAGSLHAECHCPERAHLPRQAMHELEFDFATPSTSTVASRRGNTPKVLRIGAVAMRNNVLGSLHSEWHCPERAHLPDQAVCRYTTITTGAVTQLLRQAMRCYTTVTTPGPAYTPRSTVSSTGGQKMALTVIYVPYSLDSAGAGCRGAYLSGSEAGS